MLAFLLTEADHRHDRDSLRDWPELQSKRISSAALAKRSLNIGTTPISGIHQPLPSSTLHIRPRKTTYAG